MEHEKEGAFTLPLFYLFLRLADRYDYDTNDLCGDGNSNATPKRRNKHGIHLPCWKYFSSFLLTVRLSI